MSGPQLYLASIVYTSRLFPSPKLDIWKSHEQATLHE